MKIIVNRITPPSRPARGGWIEIPEFASKNGNRRSRPARGGWIEIAYWWRNWYLWPVPPRTGRVD